MSPVSRDHHQQLRSTLIAPAHGVDLDPPPLPRRSFLTGRVLDPQLHPPLRVRLRRALGGQ